MTKRLAKVQQVLAWEGEAERIYADTQLALARTVANRRAVLPLVPGYPEIIRLTAATSRGLREGKVNERRFDKRYNHFMSVYAHLRGRRSVPGPRLAQEYVADFHPSSGICLKVIMLSAVEASRVQQ